MSVAVYVHALSDTPVMPWEETDGRRIEAFEVEGVYVIGERREDVPQMNEAELQRQHGIVQRVSEAIPSLIPARFGALLEEPELAAVLRQRKDLIRTALDHVRNNVQMTLRMTGTGTPAAQAPVVSGRDYLARRRDELLPPVPPHATTTLRELRSFILDERRKSGERGILSIYHLIRRSDVKDYCTTITSVGTPGIAVSGPFAPFAFAPDLFL